MLSPGAMRILYELDVDEHCDLVREGIHAYCGRRRVASRTVSELCWSAAVHSIIPDQEKGAKYYTITDMGRAYLRRPQLADEYRTWVMCGRGSFTVKNDRIVRVFGWF